MITTIVSLLVALIFPSQHLFAAPSSGANYVANSLKLPSFTNKDCLGTDSSGFVQEGTCTGGTSSGFSTTSADYWETQQHRFSYLFPSNSTTTVLTLSNGASIPKLTNLTSNGFVKTSGSNGTLSIDTSTYLTGNQTITLSGDLSGSGATSINATIASDAVALGTDTTGNYVATLASSGSITVGNSGSENAAVTANLNMANANTWTTLQTFANASTTALSTIYASSTVWRGGGLTTDCDNGSTSKLLWDVTTGQFSCGTDQTGGGGGSAFAWTPLTWGNSTSTTIGFFNGILVNASSTFAGGIGNATTTFNQSVQIGSTAANHALYVNPSGTYSTSDSVGGSVNMAFGNTNSGLYLWSGNASMTGATLGVDCTMSTSGTQCIRIESDTTDQSVFNIQGGPDGLGVMKISAKRAGTNSSSLISLDDTTNSFNGQGLFIKHNAATTTAALNILDGSSNSLFKIDGYGLVQIAKNSTTTGQVEIDSLSASALVSTNGTKTLTNPTVSSPLQFSSNTLSLNTSGTWSGNAGTATALAANGANCSAGSFPLGVDASGAAENCTSTASFATFSYPFPLNATSTALTFSSGLVSAASTTIGNATQTGGLNISGNATTTLAGNVSTPASFAVMNTGSQAGQKSILYLGGYQGNYKNAIVSTLNSGGSTSDLTFQYGNGAGSTALTIAGATGLLTFGNASSTALSATTLCLSSDCRTTWPSGGGSSFAYPWTPTDIAGLTISSATTSSVFVQSDYGISVANTGNTATSTLYNGLLHLDGNGDPSSVTSASGGLYLYGGEGEATLGLIGTPLLLYSNGAAFSASLHTENLTADRDVYLPDGSGTLCLTSTCPTFPWPFPSNATSTSLTFTNGITSTGTSTFATTSIAASHFQFGQAGIAAYPTLAYPKGTNSYFVIDKGGTSADASIVFRDQGAARAEFGIFDSNKTILKTVTGSYGSETFTSRLTFNNTTGWAGFGTETPSAQLEIASTSPSARVYTRITNKSTSGTDGTGLQLVAENDGHVLYLGTDAGLNGGQNAFLNWGSFGTGLFMDSTGKIGVNTTSLGAADLTAAFASTTSITASNLNSSATTTVQGTNGVDIGNASHGIHVVPGTSTTTLIFY